jgi:hypothetical protein
LTDAAQPSRIETLIETHARVRRAEEATKLEAAGTHWLSGTEGE